MKSFIKSVMTGMLLRRNNIQVLTNPIINDLDKRLRISNSKKKRARK